MIFTGASAMPGQGPGVDGEGFAPKTRQVTGSARGFKGTSNKIRA